MESVGFKEWAIVCGALGRGDQTVILRKGGIAEGRAGFSFKYRKLFFSRHSFTSRSRKPVSKIARFPQSARMKLRFDYSRKSN